MWFSKLFPGEKGKESTNGSNSLSPWRKIFGFASESTFKDTSAYDFLWTIKSFSKVTGDSEGRQTSGIFESKGYSWNLVMYPNGNIVNGQISLYLMLSNTSSHPSEAIFKVSYELFLFDQNTKDTLSKKGENLGQVRDDMGFRSMIDLKMFRDSSNGYLVKDSCIFGAKILQIVLIETPTECFHPIEKVSHEYSWKIDNFSKLDEKTNHHDKNFTAGDYLWTIRIYPDWYHYVFLYMIYRGSIHDPSAMKVSVEFTLSIIDQIEGNHQKMTYNEVLKCDGSKLGRHLIYLKDLNDPAQGFIVNDTCIIEAEVVVHGLVE